MRRFRGWRWRPAGQSRLLRSRRRRPHRPNGKARSHIQDEALALGAAAADHDLVVRRLLFLAEHRIAVLGNTGDDARHALAADAKLARIVDVDAGLIEYFQNLLALRNVIFLAG